METGNTETVKSTDSMNPLFKMKLVHSDLLVCVLIGSIFLQQNEDNYKLTLDQLNMVRE